MIAEVVLQSPLTMHVCTSMYTRTESSLSPVEAGKFEKHRPARPMCAVAACSSTACCLCFVSSRSKINGLGGEHHKPAKHSSCGTVVVKSSKPDLARELERKGEREEVGRAGKPDLPGELERKGEQEEVRRGGRRGGDKERERK